MDTRTAVADLAFQNYDFGDRVVEQADSWQLDDPSDLTKMVYLSSDGAQDQRVVFHVRFDDEKQQYEAYALDMDTGEQIGVMGA